MMRQTQISDLELLFKTEQPQSVHPKIMIDAESEKDEKEDESWYVCRNCLQKLTRPSHRYTVQGNHTHTFANPSGIVFEIACFNYAQGYSFMGPPSTEFAWFPGYAWRIIICSSCMTHLGWFFSSPSGGSFFALIVDRILMRDSAKP